MTTIAAKVEHVRRAGQDRRHHCHWPGCTAQVPPARWGCKPHWFALPAEIRRALWNSYRPGQEADQRPSEAYVSAARRAQAWIAMQQPKTAPAQGMLL